MKNMFFVIKYCKFYDICIYIAKIVVAFFLSGDLCFGFDVFA